MGNYRRCLEIKKLNVALFLNSDNITICIIRQWCFMYTIQRCAKHEPTCFNCPDDITITHTEAPTEQNRAEQFAFRLKYFLLPLTLLSWCWIFLRTLTQLHACWKDTFQQANKPVLCLMQDVLWFCRDYCGQDIRNFIIPTLILLRSLTVHLEFEDLGILAKLNHFFFSRF